MTESRYDIVVKLHVFDKDIESAIKQAINMIEHKWFIDGISVNDIPFTSNKTIDGGLISNCGCD